MMSTKWLIGVALCMTLAACSSAPSPGTPSSGLLSGRRTIILGGEAVNAQDIGGLTSWYCKDYLKDDSVLLEVGYFGDPALSGVGFIPYDGGNTGERTTYRRMGLNRRWDWGPHGTEYTFVIKPDGTGLYYDFTYVPEGESTKPAAMFKCYER